MKSKMRNAVVDLVRRFPVLSNEAVFRIVIVVCVLPLIFLLTKWKGECTCEDQIEDHRLVSTTFKGNRQVQVYLNTRDNLVMCEARRQELLKKLVIEKKLKKTLIL